MKIINYYYGYLFDCSIHGRIIITIKELEKIKRYLNNPAVLRDSFWKQLYQQDLNRRIPVKNGYWINLRTTITAAIIQRFGTKAIKTKFKHANYVLEVQNGK